MELIKEVDWFLNPIDNCLTVRGHPQPSALVTKEYLSSIERVMYETGCQFRETPPISASVYGPLSELVDLRIDLSYFPHFYPEQKVPLCSFLIVSTHNMLAVNQLNITLFPDNGQPWGGGIVRKPKNKYIHDYIPVNHYLRLISNLMTEMSDRRLLIPGPPDLKSIFPSLP